MSRFIFIHDFYRDGYTDMLAEVQDLQAQGLWTKERRARVARHEISTFHATKHKFPRMDTGYWAGRLAAIKSNRTARYPTRGKTIFVALADSKPTFCGSCGDRALWKSVPDSSGLPVLFRCDSCRQELVREQTTYRTPDGWDWDEHELLPLPQGGKLALYDRPTSIFFPTVALLGSVCLEVALHLSLWVFILELMIIVHFMTFHKEILEEFHKLIKGEDS